MKKRLVLLLSLLMVLSLTGCSKTKEMNKSIDPATIYEDAAKKMADLKDLDATVTMRMVIPQGEETMNISMDMNMKMTGANTKDMKYLSNAKMSMLGMDLDMKMFYTDGYYYIETFGQKMKYAIDYSAMLDKVNESTMQTSDLSKYMKEIKATQQGDNTIVTFTLDGEKMTEYIQDIMTELGVGLDGALYSGIEGNVETTINKEGYFSAVKMSLALDMDVEDQVVKMNMDMDMVYNNPGKAVKAIELPDLEGYTEVDPRDYIIKQ